MRQRRRIGAYGVCRDDAGRLLLVRGAAGSGAAGSGGAGPDDRGGWSVPGGRVGHGESPQDAVVRGFAEQTGLAVAVIGLRDVVSDVSPTPDGTEVVHTDRVLFDVVGHQLPREARPAGAGPRYATTWAGERDAAGLPLLPFTARLLGLPAESPDLPPSQAVRDEPITHMQRFAAYGLTTDPAGRLLLTRIAPGYPGAGTWHLPGGGTDFGEQPATGLLRELVEETGQQGRVVGLLEIVDRRVPRALGPEGYPIDWHTVRVVYRVVVDSPMSLTVLEPAGGSTAEARWIFRDEMREFPLNGLAKGTIARHLDRAWVR